MITDKLKQLAEAETKARKLKEAIERERAKELAVLPQKYGYGSLREFVAALKAVAGKKASRRRKKRTRITPKLKTDVVRGLKGGKAASAVAKESGISVASVNLIKKAAGLVKARK